MRCCCSRLWPYGPISSKYLSLSVAGAASDSRGGRKDLIYDLFIFACLLLVVSVHAPILELCWPCPCLVQATARCLSTRRLQDFLVNINSRWPAHLVLNVCAYNKTRRSTMSSSSLCRGNMCVVLCLHCERIFERGCLPNGCWSHVSKTFALVADSWRRRNGTLLRE